MSDNGGEIYLGDGLYVRHDGFSIWLRAPRETGDHVVALEPDVFRSLLDWVRAVEIQHENIGFWSGETQEGVGQ